MGYQEATEASTIPRVICQVVSDFGRDVSRLRHDPDWTQVWIASEFAFRVT